MTPAADNKGPKFSGFSREDELRHKTLNRYLEDPKVDLNDPKVQDLLEVLGLTDVSGKPMLRHMDLNDYFRGSGKLKSKFRKNVDPDTGELREKNPPPNEEKYPSFVEQPKGTSALARGANLIEPKGKQKEQPFDQELFDRMRQRLIMEFLNGLRLPATLQRTPDYDPSPAASYRTLT